MALAMFIIVIDTTIMNVSISALVVDLYTTVVGMQSAIAIYAIVILALSWRLPKRKLVEL